MKEDAKFQRDMLKRQRSLEKEQCESDRRHAAQVHAVGASACVMLRSLASQAVSTCR